jgi:hypothetical protein
MAKDGKEEKETEVEEEMEESEKLEDMFFFVVFWRTLDGKGGMFH